MNTAELIVRVLDAVADRHSEDNEHPEIGKYALLCVSKYRELKRVKTLSEAGRESRTWIVQTIMEDKKAIRHKWLKHENRETEL